MTYVSSWLIGSAKDGDFDLYVHPSAQNISGSRYLYHPTATLSLLGGMVAAMTASGIAGATATLTRDRRVKLARPAVDGAFVVQWTDTALRDLLGFTGNLAGASTYVAPNISPLLWSPAKPLMSELSPRGTRGIERPLSYFVQSPTDGSTFVTSHGSRTDQRWSASHVAVGRVFTPAKAGGEWVRFFGDVLAVGASFYVYLDVVEESSSSVDAVLAGGLGPYVFSPSARAPGWDYKRSAGFTWTDRRSDVVLPCRDVPEY